MTTRPLPDIVTHYARGEPFRSVTAQGPDHWAEVVAALHEGNAWGLARFADPHYLSRRWAVEARLHAALLARGGAPQIAQPHYAFFGTHAGWKRPGTRAYSLDIASIPAGCISVTVGDSLLSWDPDYRELVEARDGPMHPMAGQLLFPHEVNADLPGLEAQLWFQPNPGSGHDIATY